MGMASMNPISAYEQEVINRAFQSLLLTAGGLTHPFCPLDLTVFGSLVLDKDLTYWLDPVIGNDTNTGLSTDKPLKTLGELARRLPFIQAAKVVVNMAPGDYLEAVTIAKVYQQTTRPDGSSFGCIMFMGAAQKDAVVSGAASGTFDASFASCTYSHQAKMTGAGWTVDALQGKFIQITSGARTGWKYPIISNTVDTVTVGTVVDQGTHALQSASFKIVQPSVRIISNGSSADTINIEGTSARNAGLPVTFQDTTLSLSTLTILEGVFFQDIEIQQNWTSTTAAARAAVACRNANVAFRFCTLVRNDIGGVFGAQSAFTASGRGNSDIRATFWNSAMITNCPNSGLDVAVSMTRGQLVQNSSVIGSYLRHVSITDGTMNFNNCYGKTLGLPPVNATTAIFMGTNSSWTATGPFVLEGFSKAGNGGSGISMVALGTPASLNIFVQGLSDYSKTGIITNFVRGIQAQQNFDISQIQRVQIKNNTTAVSITNARLGRINLNVSTTLVSDNDEGVKLTTGNSFTNAWVMGATFTNNGSGTKDITLDNGVTWYTVAQLQAQPNRQVTDTVFNFIKSD